MQIKRNKFNEHICKQVANGEYPGYHNSKNGNKCWSLYKGYKTLLSHDKDEPGVTMELHRPNSSTLVYFDPWVDTNEIAEYITNHEYKFFDYVEQDKATAKYCSENAWTRSGT